MMTNFKKLILGISRAREREIMGRQKCSDHRNGFKCDYYTNSFQLLILTT